MKQKIGLSTSEVFGLTGISVSTIQRYVRRYRRAFSPSASMRSKGRRFLDDDIKILLFINEMIHAKRVGEIDAALENGIDMVLFDVRQFVAMFRKLSETMTLIEKLFDDVKIEKQHSGAWTSGLRDRITRVENQLEKQDKRIYRAEMIRGLKHLPKSEADEVIEMLADVLHKQHDKSAIGNALKSIFG